MKCVLLSGGGGSRLWPLSTPERPKQYLTLPDGESIFQKTLRRNEGLFDGCTVVTNRRYLGFTDSELRYAGLGGAMGEMARVVLEPKPRNTAPAIAVATLMADPDEVLLVAPTDHYVMGAQAYSEALREAERFARDGSIVVFGVEPTRPHTGYGYIQYEGSDVISFKEKPDRATAERYLATGGYLWNSGMFAYRAGTMLEELRAHCPDILEACERVVSASPCEDGIVALDEELFGAVRAESIDYAVIEHCERVKVVPARFDWCDLGGLDAYGLLAQDRGSSNKVLGERVAMNACESTSVYNTSQDVRVAVNGLKDVIVTVTDDAVYVTRREVADDVRDLAEWH